MNAVTHRARTPRFLAASRRGAVYLLVLMIAALVAVLGVSALGTARLSLSHADATARAGQARLLALAGLEHARWAIDRAVAIEDAGGAPWRSQFASGTWSPDLSLGEGSFRWRLIDDDSDLEDDPADALNIETVGTIGVNRHRLSVRLTPDEGDEPISALNASVTVHDDIAINNDIHTAFWMHANDDVVAYNKSVRAGVTAGDTVSGASYLSGAAAKQPLLDMPDPNRAFDFYLAQGTNIPRSSLPIRNGSRSIREVVLSPASNPFGDTNPLGIYIIDLENTDRISIEHSRLVATLVLLNVPDGSYAGGALNWEPAVSNYPSLMVQGNFTLAFDSDTYLYEGLFGNYNPPGTPYRGVSDILGLGAYPSVLRGLIYISGTLVIDNNDCYTEGALIIGDDLVINGDWYHISLNLWRNNPPPGFRTLTGPPVVVSGSFAQQVE